jgi:hypothetical protein
MLRRICIVALAAVVMLSGCQASTKPRTIASARPGAAEQLRGAQFSGEYRLYASRDDGGKWPAPVGEPLATQHLARGQRVGFRTENGALRGVAGDTSVPLERGQYIWQMRADKGQVDRGATTALVAAIAGVALAVAVASIF